MKMKIELDIFENKRLNNAIKLALKAGKMDIEGHYYDYQQLLYNSLYELISIFNEISLNKEYMFIPKDIAFEVANKSIDDIKDGIVHTSDIIDTLGRYEFKDNDGYKWSFDRRTKEFKNLYQIGDIIDNFYQLGVFYYGRDNLNENEKNGMKIMESVYKL